MGSNPTLTAIWLASIGSSFVRRRQEIPTQLTLNRPDLPLWTGGTGFLTVNIGAGSIDQPLEKEVGSLLSLQFTVTGNHPLTFGAAGSASLGMTAETSAKLNAFFPGDTDDVLSSTGGASYLRDGKLILALQLGADAKVNAAVTVPYADLTLAGTLDMGGDAGYTYLKMFDAQRPCGDIVKEFFAGVRLPGPELIALAPGEVISFERGGYLNIGASVSVGYQMKGTASMDWGKMALCENYGLSVIGGIDFSAKVAGRFHIDVRGIETPAGMPAGSHWVNVAVRRGHSSQVGVAADVKTEFSSQLDGLPDSGLELLGAMTGVNSKNWFNYLVHVSRAKNLEELESATDALAGRYLEKLLDTTYDQIQGQVQPALDTINKIVTAYNDFDTNVINLFDRYYDRVTQVVEPALAWIAKIDSWSEMTGTNIPDDVAWVIAALTGADPRRPLTWIAAMAGEGDVAGLHTLQGAARKLLNQIQQGAHQEILQAIKVAKAEFGIAGMMSKLQDFTSAEALKQKANTVIGGFVSRLIGKSLAEIASDADLQAAWKRLQPVIGKSQQIEQTIWKAFQDGVDSTYSASLHLEYARAAEDDHLISAQFNLSSNTGRRLFQGACHGDFRELLTTVNTPQPAQDPNPVLLTEAVFTHKISKTASFKINVIGWHDRFRYENTGLDRVATNVQQYVRMNNNGTITIDTTADLTQERKRSSGLTGREETVHTVFLVHFVAAASGALQVDPATQEYLADCIAAVSAGYDLTFTKLAATRQKLDFYLSFARDFGISLNSMTAGQIAAMLPHSEDDFGSISAAYAINFTPDGVRGAFAKKITPEILRRIIRQIVVVSYARDGVDGKLGRIGRAYATDALYQQWKQLGFAEFRNRARWEVRPAALVPNLPAQATDVNISGLDEVSVVSTLYSIEDSLVNAFVTLQALIQPSGPARLTPDQFKKKVQAFGDALSRFDNFSAGPENTVNPIFAIFDQLCRLGSANGISRTASLTLAAEHGDIKVKQMYSAAGFPNAAATA